MSDKSKDEEPEESTNKLLDEDLQGQSEILKSPRKRKCGSQSNTQGQIVPRNLINLYIEQSDGSSASSSQIVEQETTFSNVPSTDATTATSEEGSTRTICSIHSDINKYPTFIHPCSSKSDKIENIPSEPNSQSENKSTTESTEKGAEISQTSSQDSTIVIEVYSGSEHQPISSFPSIQSCLRRHAEMTSIQKSPVATSTSPRIKTPPQRTVLDDETPEMYEPPQETCLDLSLPKTSPRNVPIAENISLESSTSETLKLLAKTHPSLEISPSKVTKSSLETKTKKITESKTDKLIENLSKCKEGPSQITKPLSKTNTDPLSDFQLMSKISLLTRSDSALSIEPIPGENYDNSSELSKMTKYMLEMDPSLVAQNMFDIASSRIGESIIDMNTPTIFEDEEYQEYQEDEIEDELKDLECSSDQTNVTQPMFSPYGFEVIDHPDNYESLINEDSIDSLLQDSPVVNIIDSGDSELIVTYSPSRKGKYTAKTQPKRGKPKQTTPSTSTATSSTASVSENIQQDTKQKKSSTETNVPLLANQEPTRSTDTQNIWTEISSSSRRTDDNQGNIPVAGPSGANSNQKQVRFDLNKPTIYESISSENEIDCDFVDVVSIDEDNHILEDVEKCTKTVFLGAERVSRRKVAGPKNIKQKNTEVKNNYEVRGNSQIEQMAVFKEMVVDYFQRLKDRSLSYEFKILVVGILYFTLLIYQIVLASITILSYMFFKFYSFFRNHK